jgi:protein-tyrosine-phosphatase
VVKLGKLPPPPAVLKQWIAEMADRAIPMLHDAVEAFVGQDAEAAEKAMEAEPAVDALKRKFNAELVDLVREQKVPPEGIAPLMTIGRRFERVADQARNVCMEVLYLCTGELAKHPDAETIRILFVDEHNSCRSQIAEAVANSLDQPGFAFASAGLEPDTIDEKTLDLLKRKKLDVTHLAPKHIYQVPDLDRFQVTVGLAERVKEAFPRTPRKMVYLDWSLEDPSQAKGAGDEVSAAYEAAFEFLSSHIRELIEAVLGSRLA